MKCAEVIEWMHRYLDHDLSREEITEMFQHIDDCLSCAEIFDRLTMLSKQLEQLPDVKAPFSIVDSILPKLDELDRGLLQSGKEESEDQVVVPFSREGLRDKRQKGSSLGKRTGIGAVAAALILGIAIFNMPKEIPDAQVENLLGNDSAATSMDTDNGSTPMMKSDPADAANAQDATANSGSADEASMLETAIVESPNPSMEAIDIVEPTKSGTEPNTPAARDTSTNKPSAPAKNPKQEATAKPDASDLRSSTLSANNSEAPSEPESDMMQSMKISESYNDQGIMSLLPTSNMAGELSWTSSDGQYAAVVEGQQLVIYSIPPSGISIDKMLLDSIPLAGKWVTGEWTPDSLEFRYVTENNGQSVENVYVVAATDTSSSVPEGTPVVSPTNSAVNAPSATSSAK